jgi:predicted amidohydrolase
MTAAQLTVAVAQSSSVPGKVEDNAARFAVLVGRCAERGARLVVFPELSLIDYDLSQLGRPELWLSPDDARLDSLRDQCRASATNAVVGAGVLAADGRRLLASLVVTQGGDVRVHGKTHLHGPEREVFDPGGPSHDLLDIDGWSAALAVCYDVAVPAHAQSAADAGADLYVVSSYYESQGHERMGIHLASRAMDHRMYALGSNHARTPSRDSCGGSGIWGPDGSCERRAGYSVEVMMGHLEHDLITDLRRHDATATAPLVR